MLRSITIARSLILGFLSIGSLATHTAADEATDSGEGLHIEDAVITSADAGKSARLRFAISNYGPVKVRLNAVRTSIARDTKLMITMPGGGTRTVSGLPVLQEETLDLTTSHIMVKLVELKRPLNPGATVEFDVVFQNFSVPATAHVH